MPVRAAEIWTANAEAGKPGSATMRHSIGRTGLYGETTSIAFPISGATPATARPRATGSIAYTMISDLVDEPVVAPTAPPSCPTRPAG
ncbi:MAG: hypothetical protein ABFC89_09645 [Methanospirillum sp.]